MGVYICVCDVCGVCVVCIWCVGDCVGYVCDMWGFEICVSGWYREGFGVCSVWEVCGGMGGVLWCVYVGCVRYVCIVCGIWGVYVCDMGAYVWWECVCVYVGEYGGMCGVCMACGI